MDLWTDTRETYRDFATYAADDSPVFQAWALGVVEDPEVLAWLGQLPQAKQQPNLVFAAARWHGLPGDASYADLRAALLGDPGPLRATVLARATQTNEVGRTATLLPALRLAVPDGPVALLEVGASAGLCLYPDRWSYRYRLADGDRWVGGTDERVLDCRVDALPGAELPLPDARPEVAWRGGLDLNPLDVTDAESMRWLQTLVWPEHHDRRALLRQAVEVARADPPDLRRGDLSTDLPALVEEAAAHGTVVVQHSAVLAYLPPEGRERFHDLMTELVADGRCHWISNEGRAVLPRVSATGPEPPSGSFVLGLDGRAVAWTHGHGRTLTWTAT